MSRFKKVCHDFLDNAKMACQDFSNPYIKQIEGFVNPLRIWRFGELNDDKIIYFITNIGSKRAGTFSNYLVVLNEISYANAMGWIPVVDDTAGLLHKLKEKGKRGTTYLQDIFQIENEISVAEVLHSRSVIFSDTARRINMMKTFNKTNELYKIRYKPFFNMDRNEIAYWRDFARDNFQFRDGIQRQLEAAYKAVIGGRKDVMAVAVREGKMSLSKTVRTKAREELQPSIKEILGICRKYFKEWNCSYIYLSCEARETIEMFQREFTPEKVLFLRRYRFPMKELDIHSFRNGDKFHNSTYKIPNYDLDYIKEMYIMSKGDYFISAMNSGTEAAYIMSSGFKGEYIIRKS